MHVSHSSGASGVNGNGNVLLIKDLFKALIESRKESIHVRRDECCVALYDNKYFTDY